MIQALPKLLKRLEKHCSLLWFQQYGTIWRGYRTNGCLTKTQILELTPIQYYVPVPVLQGANFLVAPAPKSLSSTAKYFHWLQQCAVDFFFLFKPLRSSKFWVACYFIRRKPLFLPFFLCVLQSEVRMYYWVILNHELVHLSGKICVHWIGKPHLDFNDYKSPQVSFLHYNLSLNKCLLAQHPPTL